MLYTFLFIIFVTEFHPGVPWKGLQNIDPENDPDVTPGSVPTGPTINTTIQDVNRYLLKSGGKHTNHVHICVYFILSKKGDFMYYGYSINFLLVILMLLL